MAQDVFATSGPVDYLVVDFPRPTRCIGGRLATELASLVDAELVQLLDLVVIEKDAQGEVISVELEDLDDVGDLEPFRGRLARRRPPDVLDDVVEHLQPGHAAAVIVWANTWAAPIADAARSAGGELVASGRLPLRSSG